GHLQLWLSSLPGLAAHASCAACDSDRVHGCQSLGTKHSQVLQSESGVHGGSDSDNQRKPGWHSHCTGLQSSARNSKTLRGTSRTVLKDTRQNYFPRRKLGT